MGLCEIGTGLSLTSTKSAVSIICKGAHGLMSDAHLLHHSEIDCPNSDSRIKDGLLTETGTAFHMIFKCFSRPAGSIHFGKSKSMVQ